MMKKILGMLKMRLGAARINRKGFAKIGHELDVDSYEKGYWTGVVNCLSGTIRIVRDMEKSPSTSIEAARKHHKRHGDMDGHTCLLAKCALHYPQSSKKED